MSFYQWQGNDLIVFVRTQPNASSDQLGEIIQQENLPDQLKVRISAPAIDGKANKHLLKFLSHVFNVSHSRISIESGETSRNKKLRIQSPNSLPDIFNE